MDGCGGFGACPVTGFSDGSHPSIADTTISSEPSTLFFRRMNELSMRFCMSPPTGRTIVALNRKLDEVENILSISSHGDNENPVYATTSRLWSSDNFAGGNQFAQSVQQIAIASPPPLGSVGRPKPTTHAIDDERPQLLSRVSGAMELLRQRQREMAVRYSHVTYHVMDRMLICRKATP